MSDRRVWLLWSVCEICRQIGHGRYYENYLGEKNIWVTERCWSLFSYSPWHDDFVTYFFLDLSNRYNYTGDSSFFFLRETRCKNERTPKCIIIFIFHTRSMDNIIPRKKKIVILKSIDRTTFDFVHTFDAIHWRKKRMHVVRSSSPLSSKSTYFPVYNSY